MLIQTIRRDWFSNIRNDLLAGTMIEVTGLNEASATMVDKFALHDKDGAAGMLIGH
ncbi:hypothetical protein SRABI118_00670 [Massilia sp. Bi118]|uniref:hypothetical protein n=1 Tax=Massilia sp. Bi118 TaxID=2822346 RepID=UPI001D7702E5|nr:hypothetical protein [Massilia sp. Bi118]CAH0157433.1 hypothetical protein SRABI118_00670 [Massilia sp. Bi118]